MDLFELEKEKKIKILKRKTINNKIKLLRDQLGLKATDYSAVKIKSTPKRNKELAVLGKIEEMEKDLEYIEQELNIIDESLNSLYKIFNEYKDRDKQIYIEKKLYKWSNAKISVKHDGISKSQINRIVKEIKDGCNRKC